MLNKDRLTSPLASTRQAEEVAKFDQLADEWRKDGGKFKHISAFNRCRVQCIVERLISHFDLDKSSAKPLLGLTILDVGCGAGLVCEGLAELGALVTGIDASAVNIEVAKRNAQAKSLAIDYHQLLAEHLVNPADQQQAFDVVLNTEVIEHVDDQAGLTDVCARLLAPNGMLVMATLNRTFKSFWVAIVGAEYVLRMLPRGTHDWRWFVKPQQLRQWLHPHGLQQTNLIGVNYNPFSKTWRSGRDSSVNYMLFAAAVTRFN